MKFLESIFFKVRPKVYQAVLIRDVGEEWMLDIVKLKKEKSTCSVDWIEQNISFEEGCKKLSKQAITNLFVYSHNTIFKTVKVIENQTSEDVLEELFPTLQVEDFWVEKYYDNDRIYVSITQQSQVEEILKKFEKFKVYPFRVYIGEQIFENKNDSSEYLMEDVLFGNQDYSIDIISRNNLRGIGELLLHVGLLKNHQARFESSMNFIYHYLSKKIQLGALIFVFGILMINTVWFNTLNKRNNELNDILSTKSSSIDLYEEKKNSILKKEKIVKNLALDKKLKLAKFSDSIGESIPTSISLINLSLLPNLILMENSSRDKSLISDRILIQGESSSDLKFDVWIQNLKDRDWVSQLSIENFQYDPQVHKSIFEITLYLNE